MGGVESSRKSLMEIGRRNRTISIRHKSPLPAPAKRYLSWQWIAWSRRGQSRTQQNEDDQRPSGPGYRNCPRSAFVAYLALVLSF